MKKMNRRQICLAVRKSLELYIKNKGDAFDNSLIKINDEKKPVLSLGGYCGIASWCLHYHFKKNGYESIVVYGFVGQGGSGHCWVESGDKIYDVTATQFYKKKIFISDLDSKFYSKSEIKKKKKDFINWERWQSPNNKEMLSAVNKNVKKFIESKR